MSVKSHFRFKGAKPQKVTLSGYVGSIISYNSKNNQTTVTLKITEQDRLQISDKQIEVIGGGAECLPNEFITVEGNFHKMGRGSHIENAKIRNLTLDTIDYITAFLKNKRSFNLSSADIRAIINDSDGCPQSALKLLCDEEDLVEIGIRPDRARIVANYFQLRTKHGKTLAYLTAAEIAPDKVRQITKKYKEETERTVFLQPYRLMRDIKGIGFDTCDRLAFMSGIKSSNKSRIEAGIRAAMDRLMTRGDCGLSESLVINSAMDLLQLPLHQIRDVFETMIEEDNLRVDRLAGVPYVYTAAMHQCETQVAQAIIERASDLDLSDALVEQIAASEEQESGMTLHINQQLAVRMAIKNRLSIITGGPGRGKTATMMVLIKAIKKIDPDHIIQLAAPTGMAAVRLGQSTGEDANTIHRLLKWLPQKGGFTHNENNPLAADTVIIDESSMNDIWLVRSLLRAIKPEARIVFVGDSDQLPSVGPGNVLNDMISSGHIPVTRLTKIYRQGEGSGIARDCDRVNKRAFPDYKEPGHGYDVWGLKSKKNDMQDDVINLIFGPVAARGFHIKNDQVQILTAGHQHETGTIALNARIQELVNPRAEDSDYIITPIREFRVGDKVMQLKNDYDKEIYNGDVGKIVAITGTVEGYPKTDMLMTIAFDDDREIPYRRSEIDELTHAWAISIHKSQGSEFPAVITVLSRAHRNLLQKNILFTAMSRAQNLCCIVHDHFALNDCLRLENEKSRNTLLKERIIDFAETSAQAKNDTCNQIIITPDNDQYEEAFDLV